MSNNNRFRLSENIPLDWDNLNQNNSSVDCTYSNIQLDLVCLKSLCGLYSDPPPNSTALIKECPTFEETYIRHHFRVFEQTK